MPYDTANDILCDKAFPTLHPSEIVPDEHPTPSNQFDLPNLTASGYLTLGTFLRPIFSEQTDRNCANVTETQFLSNLPVQHTLTTGKNLLINVNAIMTGQILLDCLYSFILCLQSFIQF